MNTIEAVLGRLAKARNQAGLTQAQAAKIIGVESASTISHWESGARELSVVTLLKLAEIYDVSVSWLMTGSNPNFDAERFANVVGIASQDLAKLTDLLQSLRQDDPPQVESRQTGLWHAYGRRSDEYPFMAISTPYPSEEAAREAVREYVRKLGLRCLFKWVDDTYRCNDRYAHGYIEQIIVRSPHTLR